MRSPAEAKLLGDPKLLSLAGTLYQHPLIAANANGKSGPSYIDPQDFALALRDIATQNGGLQKTFFTAPIAALARQAGFDPDKFQNLAAGWFDNAMNRPSGVYQRQTQAVMMAIGLVIALTCNLNSVGIAKSLFMLPRQRSTRCWFRPQPLRRRRASISRGCSASPT